MNIAIENGPFIDGDFPLRYVKLPEGNIITPQSQQPGTLGTLFFTTPQVFPCHNHQSIGSQASTGDGAGDHHDAHHGFPATTKSHEAFLKWESPIAQWEFQDPKMEVLYHIKPYFLGIFPEK